MIGRVIFFDSKKDAINFVLNYYDLMYEGSERKRLGSSRFNYRDEYAYCYRKDKEKLKFECNILFSMTKENWNIVVEDGKVERIEGARLRNWHFKGEA